MRLVILPPHDRWPRWTDPPDSAEPDLEATYRLLAASHGWSVVRLDVRRDRWNPFAGAHGVLAAIDPVRALAVLLRHRDAALVLGFFESSTLLILLLRRMLAFRAPVFVFDVGVPGGWRLRRAILRLVLPRADRLLPLGTAQVAGLVALGAAPDRVRPVLTCTYPDFFVAAPDRPDGYVLAVGDDVSRDYPTFLAACAGLDRRVVIRSRLLGADAVPANVEVLSHALSSAQYRELIAGALCVVLPLHPGPHAGGVTTLLEAMSSAKAVVVTRSEGLADYLRDGTCRLVPPDDPAALRDAIDQLAGDAAARTAIGRAARDFIVTDCSPPALAARLDEIWRTLHAAA